MAQWAMSPWASPTRGVSAYMLLNPNCTRCRRRRAQQCSKSSNRRQGPHHSQCLTQTPYQGTPPFHFHTQTLQQHLPCQPVCINGSSCCVFFPLTSTPDLMPPPRSYPADFSNTAPTQQTYAPTVATRYSPEYAQSVASSYGYDDGSRRASYQYAHKYYSTSHSLTLMV